MIFLDIGNISWYWNSKLITVLTLFFYRKKLVQYKELSCLQNCSFWWSDTKIKVVNFAKDYFSHFWQRFSSTDNAPTSILNSPDIWYTFTWEFHQTNPWWFFFKQLFRLWISTNWLNKYLRKCSVQSNMKIWCTKENTTI